MTILLELGDIVGVRSKGLLSWGIALGSCSIGEKPTRLSHVGLITRGGNWENALITEALTTVVERPLKVYDGVKMVIYSPITTLSKRAILINQALRYKGRKYGWFKLIPHFLDFCLNGAYVFRRLCLIDRYPICSWLVGHCYSHISFTFGKPLNALQPDDIDDFCKAHPSLFVCKLDFKEVDIGTNQGS